MKDYTKTARQPVGMTCDGCIGQEAELNEILRVAKDNPGGLVDFLQINYPKEMGLSKEQHIHLLDNPPKRELVGLKTVLQFIDAVAIKSDRPPAFPKKGDIYEVENCYGGNALGDFNGNEGKLAFYDGNHWSFVATNEIEDREGQ